MGPENEAKYNFFHKLFGIVRGTDKKVQTNDPQIVRQIFLRNKQQFGQQDDRKVETMIFEFFSAPEFMKRLLLHREHICKSKTKKESALKLYYIEIPQADRQLNLIDFVPAHKGRDPEAGQVIHNFLE